MRKEGPLSKPATVAKDSYLYKFQRRRREEKETQTAVVLVNTYGQKLPSVSMLLILLCLHMQKKQMPFQ
jgi:hypothetical protein